MLAKAFYGRRTGMPPTKAPHFAGALGATSKSPIKDYKTHPQLPSVGKVGNDIKRSIKLKSAKVSVTIVLFHYHCGTAGVR